MNLAGQWELPPPQSRMYTHCCSPGKGNCTISRFNQIRLDGPGASEAKQHSILDSMRILRCPGGSPYDDAVGRILSMQWVPFSQGFSPFEICRCRAEGCNAAFKRSSRPGLGWYHTMWPLMAIIVFLFESLGSFRYMYIHILLSLLCYCSVQPLTFWSQVGCRGAAQRSAKVQGDWGKKRVGHCCHRKTPKWGKHGIYWCLLRGNGGFNQPKLGTGVLTGSQCRCFWSRHHISNGLRPSAACVVQTAPHKATTKRVERAPASHCFWRVWDVKRSKILAAGVQHSQSCTSQNDSLVYCLILP